MSIIEQLETGWNTIHSIRERHAREQGGTWDMVTGKEISGLANASSRGPHWIAVSPYPQAEFSVPGGYLADAHIEWYIDQHRDLLSLPQHCLGTWYGTDDGQSYIDVVQIVMGMDNARKIAVQANQVAVYNLTTGTCIMTKDIV